MDQFMSLLPEPMQLNGTFLYILLIFLLLFFLLKKFYVDRYAEVLYRREDIIEGAQRKYSDVETLYASKLEEIEKQLKQARANANSLRERLISEARGEKDQLVSRARSSAQEQRDRAADQVAQTVEEQKQVLRSHVDELAADIAARLLNRELT